jgi:hypothetical protein
VPAGRAPRERIPLRRAAAPVPCALGAGALRPPVPTMPCPAPTESSGAFSALRRCSASWRAAVERICWVDAAPGIPNPHPAVEAASQGSADLPVGVSAAFIWYR